MTSISAINQWRTLLNAMRGFLIPDDLNAAAFIHKVSSLDFLGPDHDAIDNLLYLLSDHAAQDFNELWRGGHAAAKYLRAAAVAVQKARESFAPAGRNLGLARIADELDRLAVGMEPPALARGDELLERGRGRPSYAEFNCFVVIMKWWWEQNGDRATANYDDATGEYGSAFIDFLEGRLSRLPSAPRRWPKNRKARARQIKTVLDAARRETKIRTSAN